MRQITRPLSQSVSGGGGLGAYLGAPTPVPTPVALVCLQFREQDMLRQDRQLAMPHARRPIDRMRYRRSRRIDDDLANRLRTKGARGLVGMLEPHVDLPYIQARGQTVGLIKTGVG